MFKILSIYTCWKKYIKCNILRVAVCPSYIWDARFLKVNPPYTYIFSSALHFQTLVSYSLGRFEVLTTVMTKIQYPEETTLYQLVNTNWHFRGACYLHLQGSSRLAKNLLGCTNYEDRDATTTFSDMSISVDTVSHVSRIESTFFFPQSERPHFAAAEEATWYPVRWGDKHRK